MPRKSPSDPASMPDAEAESGRARLGRLNSSASAPPELVSGDATTRALRATMAATGHDLMQPLQIVSHSLERLNACQQADRDRMWIEAARTQVQRLARGLTELVQAAVGPVAMRAPVSQCLAGIFDETEAAWAMPAEVSGITLKIERFAIPVRTDRSRLRSILDNLISNAFKYGGGRVHLSAAILPLGVRIDVLNNGGPIPQDIQSRFFDPFYQADPSSGGLGIGLSIIREDCRSLGHRIEVASEASHTRFSIFIPDDD